MTWMYSDPASASVALTFYMGFRLYPLLQKSALFFSLKGQIANTSSLAGHTVSVATIRLCCTASEQS